MQAATDTVKSLVNGVMGSHGQLQYTTQQERQAVQLVAAYCGLDSWLQCREGPELQLCNGHGDVITGQNTICISLALRNEDRADQLLGALPEQRAKVQEWLSFRSGLLPGLPEDKLLQLNAWLTNRVFLAAQHITLADLLIYATVHRALVNIPPAQVLERYPALFRWADFVQHIADAGGVFSRLQLAKPHFRLPLAPASASAAPKGQAVTAKQPPKLDKRLVASQAAVPGSGQASATTSTPAAAAAAAGDSSSSTLTGAATPSASAGDCATSAAPAAAALAPKKEGEKGKKTKPSKAERQAAAGGAAPQAAGEAAEPHIGMADIRVGQILSVEQHPNADSLYVEQIDLGEAQPRQIVSGLVKFVPKDQLHGRRVVVVCNLKPAKMRDVMSAGMVLCASDSTHEKVDPISPPEGVPNGERVAFTGYETEPVAQFNAKKKEFDKLKEHLATDALGVAVWRGAPFMTTQGPITSRLNNATVG